MLQSGIQSTVTTSMLTDQGQLHQRPYRPVRAQHRIDKLEQRIRPPGQTGIELPPEPSQFPGNTVTTTLVHTEHETALGYRYSSLDKKNHRPRAASVIKQGPDQSNRG